MGSKTVLFTTVYLLIEYQCPIDIYKYIMHATYIILNVLVAMLIKLKR